MYLSCSVTVFAASSAQRTVPKSEQLAVTKWYRKKKHKHSSQLYHRFLLLYREDSRLNIQLGHDQYKSDQIQTHIKTPLSNNVDSM